jgi:tetratricopeptide (TPR) repeat protein
MSDRDNQEVISDAEELLDSGLGHERQYWWQLFGGSSAKDEVLTAVEQLMSLLTLVGGTRSAQDTRALMARTPKLRVHDNQARERILELLRRLYAIDGGLRGIEPDLLGERLVRDALAADDELLEAALGPSASGDHARRAFTVLTRLARQDARQLRWLELAMKGFGERRVAEALAVAAETGPPLPQALADLVTNAVPKLGRRLVQQVRPKISEDTSFLVPLGLAVAEVHLTDLRSNRDRKGAGHTLKLLAAFDELASFHEAAGKFDAALGARQAAARQAAKLERTNDARDRARHSGALNNLAVALSRVGRFEEALATAQQAEMILRELARRQPDAYNPDWATSLAVPVHSFETRLCA